MLGKIGTELVAASGKLIGLMRRLGFCDPVCSKRSLWLGSIDSRRGGENTPALFVLTVLDVLGQEPGSPVRGGDMSPYWAGLA